jgi:hypothetical protein
MNVCSCTSVMIRAMAEGTIVIILLHVSTIRHLHDIILANKFSRDDRFSNEETFGLHACSLPEVPVNAPISPFSSIIV